MRPLQLFFCVVIVLVSAHLTLAQQPAPSATPPAGLMTTIRQRGELRVGTAMFIPWSMHNNKGELMGFEIDVANKLAESLGVSTKITPVPVSELIPELDSGRFDIIVSGLYVTPARAIHVNFSDFYSQSEITLLANRKLAGTFRSISDFNRPFVTIGVTAGTLYPEIARKNFPKAKLKQFAEESEALEMVQSGELHAAVAASPRPDIDALRFPDKVFLPLPKPLSSQGEAFAVRKGDLDFVNFLNSWIKYYEQNGWLEDRRTFWFKTLNWANDL